MDRSAIGDDFVGSGPAVCQLALRSDLKGTAVFVPQHGAIIRGYKLESKLQPGPVL